MRELPPLPDVADAPAELFERGHLWIQELVAGEPLRVSVTASGRVAVADRRRPLGDDPPPSLRHAVRYVRERLDRDRLLAAADDPTSATLFGVATRFEGVPYGWERLPGFLGTDVFSGDRGALLPPDAVERVFKRLGLTPVDAFEKEVEAAYFDPAGYELPGSAWYDGPAAGVVFRNKRGQRAALRRARGEPGRASGDDRTTPAEVADRFATDERVRRAASAVERAGGRPTVDAVAARLVDAIAREEHARLSEDLDWEAVESAVAERVARSLG